MSPLHPGTQHGTQLHQYPHFLGLTGIGTATWITGLKKSVFRTVAALVLTLASWIDGSNRPPSPRSSELPAAFMEAALGVRQPLGEKTLLHHINNSKRESVLRLA